MPAPPDTDRSAFCHTGIVRTAYGGAREAGTHHRGGEMRKNTRIIAAVGPVLIAAFFVLSIDSVSIGKDKPVPRPRFYRPVIRGNDPDIFEYDPRANVIAAADTYCIASYDFEQYDWQGWTRIDNTIQADMFVRVEDFAGLSGGAHGRLVPIEGMKSIWIGTRPGGGPYLCSWSSSAPGYGNDWNQWLTAHVITGVEYGDTATVTLSYHLVCDTEEGRDVVKVCYEDQSGHDVILAEYSGVVDTVASHTFEYYNTCFNAYFKFRSDETVSDQDGLIDTDGAVIIDSITVHCESPLGPIDNFDDFEADEAGEPSDGFWWSNTGEPYGAFSGLAANLLDRDPCASNIATVIMFFNYSIYPSGEYPGLYNTPFCYGSMGLEDPCQDEMIVSPWLDLDRYSAGCDEHQDTDIPPGELGGMGGVMLSYSAYIDLPVENLVFHTWKVRNIEDGCPGRWLEEPLVRYYSDDGLWYRFEHDISDLVTSDSIQVALGVVDMCSVWYGIYGDCAEHTPTPWFDNVKVSRYVVRGPQWSCQGADLFQDNFPSTDEMESYVRADMAADISPISYPGIVPGDSVVVTCWAPIAGGLDTLGTGEARVYCHARVHYIGGFPTKPDLSGPQLAGTYGRYISDDGDWTVLLCEPALTSTGAVAPDRYCVDLNDELFTRGYLIEYYFKAYDLDGASTTLPEDAETVPPDPCLSGRERFEFTCLPTLRKVPDLLFVDDFDGRGTPEGLVQAYFDHTVETTLAQGEPLPDRYDVNQPSAMAGNGLGSRARLAHFTVAYQQIMWDSGDLSEGTLVSGESSADKSDDIGFLIDYLDAIPWSMGSGLMVMGDNVASDVMRYTDGQALLADWCGVSLAEPSYYEFTGGYSGGGETSPLLAGLDDGPFDGFLFYIDGGCPILSRFDVLDLVGPGMPGISYPEYGGDQYYAGVYSTVINSLGSEVRTQWYGFSFMRIRNYMNGPLARTIFLRGAWRHIFYGPNFRPDYTGDETPAVTALAGVYPNPFNPVTRVVFSLKKKGHVSMRIYDVSGRLVRVLADEVREAGSYEVVWDGTNDRGRATVSGIYFCRMEAVDYERTMKMVQLR